MTAAALRRPIAMKKADVAEHPKVFDHVGLLINEPPGKGRAAPYLVIRHSGGSGFQ